MRGLVKDRGSQEAVLRNTPKGTKGDKVHCVVAGTLAHSFDISQSADQTFWGPLCSSFHVQ